MIKNIIDWNKNVSTLDIKMEQLREIFPGAFHRNTIDLEYMKNQLKSIKATKEGYELNFLGKSYAKLLAAIETETVISPDANHNKQIDNRNSENLYISADNLDALKHLLKSYWRKIKMVYIDPPYNTGSDGFVYNDSFNFSKKSLIDKLGLSEEESERVLGMISGNSSSHSAWLTFMYPRLYLARQLLREDGAIFISIDDNEVSNLKLVCNDIFGENNFAGQITIVGNPRGRDYGGIARMHDYLLVYTKSELTELNLIEDKDGGFSAFDEYGGYELRELRNRNIKFNDKNRPNLYYPFYINPNNQDANGLLEISLEKQDNWIELYPIPSQGINTVWRWGKAKAQENMNINIKAKPMMRGGYQIVEKYRESKVMARSVWWSKETNTEKGTLTVKELFDGKKVFDYPKPVELLEKIITMGSVEDEEDIILDFFSGSATTAHAVLKLNAINGGNRKFIMIQLPEQVNEFSEAYKYGYRYITEIGIERIKRASKSVESELLNRKANSGLLADEVPDTGSIDTGFKVFYIKDIEENKLKLLETFNPNVLIADKGIFDEFGVDTVLTTWKILDGYGLTKDWAEFRIADYSAYQIEETVYLLNPDISNEAIKALLESYESEIFNCNKIVIFGYSFTMSEIQTIKDNLKQVESIRHITLDIIVRY
jgi:adenine specific DNA methylase Mod